MAVGKFPTIGLICLLLALAAATLGTLYHSHQLHGRVKRARLSTTDGLDSTRARLYVDAELEPPVWSMHQIVPQGARCVLHTKTLDVIANVDGVSMAPIGMAMSLEATVHAATMTRASGSESPELECIFNYAINFFQSGLLLERSASATWRLPSGSQERSASATWRLPSGSQGLGRPSGFRGVGSATVERRGPVSALHLPKGALQLHQEAMLRVSFPASTLAEDLIALLQDADLSLESHVAYAEATSGAFKVQKNVSAPVHLVADGRGGFALSAPFNASALIDFPKLAAFLAGGKGGPTQQRAGGAVKREVRIVAEEQSSLVAKVLGPSHTLGWRNNEASSGRTMAKQLARRIGAALLGEAATPAESGRLLSSNPAGRRDEVSIVFDETIYSDDTELDIDIKIAGDMDSMDIEASMFQTEEGGARSTLLSATAGLRDEGEAMKMELNLEIPGVATAMVDIIFAELYSMSGRAWLKNADGQMLGELQCTGKSVGGSDGLAVSFTSDIFDATLNVQEADGDVSNDLLLTAPDGSIVLDVTGSGTRTDRKADLSWVVKFDNDGTLEQLCTAKIFTTASDREVWFEANIAMGEKQTPDAKLELEIKNDEGDLSMEGFDLGAFFEIEQPDSFNLEDPGLPCLTGACRLGISSHGGLGDGPADVVTTFSSEDRHKEELLGGGLTLHHSEGRLELVGDAREQQEPVLSLKAEAHDMLLEASATLFIDQTIDVDLRVGEVEPENEPADAYELELKVEADGSVVLVANASISSDDAGAHAKLDSESSDVAVNGLFRIHNNGNGSAVRFADFDTSLDLDVRDYNDDRPCGSFFTLRATASTAGGNFNGSASVSTDSEEEDSEECQVATWLDVQMTGTNADGVIDLATASGNDVTHDVKLKITQLSEDEYGVNIVVDDAVEFTGWWQDKNYSVVVDILDPGMQSTTQVLLTDRYVAVSLAGSATDDVTLNVSYHPADAAIPGFKELWLRGHMTMKEGNPTTVNTNVTMLLTPEEGIYDFMLEAEMYEMQDTVKDYIFTVNFDAQMPYATGTKQVATIEGSMTMSVEDPEAFVSDENAQAALKESIAHFAGNGVSADDVSLVFSYEAARRRLLEAAGRRMAGVVNVNYTIKAESSEDEVVDFEAIKDNLEQVTSAEMTTTCTDFLSEALGEEAASAYRLAVIELAPPTMTMETIGAPDAPDSNNLESASAARGIQGESSSLLLLAPFVYLFQSLRREAAL